MAIVELTADEKILKIIHRHYFSFIDDMVAIGFFFLFPVVFAISFFYFIPDQIVDAIFIENKSTEILYITVTGFLIAWLYAWWRWTDHFLNVTVITNERIFEIKQHGFFSRKVSSFGLDRIQNITTTQKGILSTMFNFGDMHIETAGENENLNMTTVPNPSTLKKFIDELQDQYTQKR